MSDVKRFWADLCVHHVEAVLYSDYAALEAELATVKKVAYGNMELLDENQKLKAELAKLRAGQEPVRFWFIGDAGQQKGATYCKKSSRDGSLAFFECEEDAKRAALRHPGTEVYPVEYYRKPQATPQPSAVPDGWRETIRAVFLRNGFTVKDGQTDLKPYVYAAAEELLSIARAAWQRTQSAGVPEAKVTGEWESARIGDFNAGWNACRDSVFTLMKKAAYMELDTTKRSIAIQDELRAQLAAIQGGMGEVVGFDRNAAYAACPESGCDWGSFYVGWKAAAAQHQRITAAMAVGVERLREQRDSMAQILRDLVHGCKWRFMRPRIDQALQEVDGGN